MWLRERVLSKFCILHTNQDRRIFSYVLRSANCAVVFFVLLKYNTGCVFFFFHLLAVQIHPSKCTTVSALYSEVKKQLYIIFASPFALTFRQQAKCSALARTVPLSNLALCCHEFITLFYLLISFIHPQGKWLRIRKKKM